jgi:hypothetical protein
VTITLETNDDQRQILLDVLEQRTHDITRYILSKPVSKHTQELFEQRENIYNILQQIDRSVDHMPEEG